LEGQKGLRTGTASSGGKKDESVRVRVARDLKGESSEESSKSWEAEMQQGNPVGGETEDKLRANEKRRRWKQPRGVSRREPIWVLKRKTPKKGIVGR